MPLLIFFQPLYHCIPQQRRTEPRARPCLFLNFGYNHGLDSYKMLDATTGMAVYSRDVAWHQTREQLTFPARMSETGAEHHWPTTDYAFFPPHAAVPLPPNILPHTATTSPPLPAHLPPPASAPLHAPASTATPAPSMSLQTPVPGRILRKLGPETDVRIPGRTRGETRTS